MRIVGHRGACGHAPGNTLLSFQKAMALGCARTELDVHLSRDGEVVVIHDATVDSTTNGTGKVADLTLAELKALDCADGLKIPTLQEVIALCRGRIALQIEIKAEPAVAPVSEMILANGIQDAAVITSFQAAWLKAIKSLNPLLAAGLLFPRPLADLWDVARDISLDYICPKGGIVDEVMVREAHERGLLVYAYGVNDALTWARLAKMGVDDVGTDFPDLADAT